MLHVLRTAAARSLQFYSTNGNALIGFSQTNSESSPWWTVSLDATYYLGTVQVTSPVALTNVVVRAGMNPAGVTNPVCATAVSLVPSGTVAINCTSGLGAKYVTIMINSTGAQLSLCHVQVYSHSS